MRTIKNAILAIAATLSCSTMTNAANNEYVPLVQEGATWNYASFVHKKPYPYTVYIQGDTSLLGVTYKKCYIKFYENYADSCLTENEKSYLASKNPQLIAFLREENKKVYCLYKHANYPKLFNNYEWGKCVRQEINDKAIDYAYGEWLIYDFNDVESVLNAPRSTKQYPHLNMRYSVEKADEVEIGNTTRKRYQLRTNYYFATDSLNYSILDGLYIIEGLGFVRIDRPIESAYPIDVDFFLSPKADAVQYVMYNNDMYGLAQSSFLNKVENGQKVASSCYDKIKFYTDGGSTGVESVATDANQGDGQYYNLMGQKVSPENLGSGIYIHNHKKVMVRK